MVERTFWEQSLPPFAHDFGRGLSRLTLNFSFSGAHFTPSHVLKLVSLRTTRRQQYSGNTVLVFLEHYESVAFLIRRSPTIFIFTVTCAYDTAG